MYGLAAVIIGVSLMHFYASTRLARGLRKSRALRFLGSPQGTTAVVLGSVLYKLCIQIAMSMGLPTNMMKLITAALFLLVLVLSGILGEALGFVTNGAFAILGSGAEAVLRALGAL